MVMGGFTIPEEELEEEDQALHEHPEEAEAVPTLCWDSRAASMKSFLTLFVAISDLWGKLAPKCWAYKISVSVRTGSIWILDAVSAFSGMSVLTVSGEPAPMSYI